MRVAIIGKSGQLARCLAETVPTDAEFVCFGRGEIDITDSSMDFIALTEYRPQLLINAAAYTAVDKAETDSEAAFALNSHGPARIAEFCAAHEIPLIHVSTDYVFDGNRARPYVETDKTAPINVYGESKLAGERSVADRVARHIIIRTSWLYSAFGNNFVKTMLRLAAERNSLRVVADQYGRPTSANALAGTIWTIAGQIDAHADVAGLCGIYHYADVGETTWADFAEAIFESLEARRERRPRLERIASDDYPMPAKRPRYSVLDTTKIETAFNIRPPSWRDSLRDVVTRLRREVPA